MLLESVSLSGKSSNTISPAIISDRRQTIPEINGESGKEEKSADLSRVKDVVIDLQNKMRVLHNVNLSFSVHSASGKVMVTVVDEDMGEVIREIPSRELLDLATKLEEAIGLIFDKKV
jgi:flagellar protein FlaG